MLSSNIPHLTNGKGAGCSQVTPQLPNDKGAGCSPVTNLSYLIVKVLYSWIKRTFITST